MRTKVKNSEMDAFNNAMDMILRADPKAVKEEMDREKQANIEKRKAKKKPFASARDVDAKDG